MAARRVLDSGGGMTQLSNTSSRKDGPHAFRASYRVGGAATCGVACGVRPRRCGLTVSAAQLILEATGTRSGDGHRGGHDGAQRRAP